MREMEEKGAEWDNGDVDCVVREEDDGKVKSGARTIKKVG